MCEHRLLKLFRKWLSSRNFFWAIAAWVACLLVGSLQPVRLGAARGGTMMHLILHLLAFGIPAFLLQLHYSRQAWVWVAAFTLLPTLSLAFVIELTQTLIYRNSFEWADVFADLLGTFIAILPRLLTGDGRSRDSA